MKYSIYFNQLPRSTRPLGNNAPLMFFAKLARHSPYSKFP
uniref:Uncharacterized protein n=1 Tax=Podoviridae sp. ctiuS14 TaxID=2827620 RepID=A0A8S5LMC9_9CAUD|nr:MAG TPA: hypothetical protein [Podoviridae sp. ctiuS14]